MCDQPSTLEMAMTSLIHVFHSYSGKEGDKYKLNNGELKNLLLDQLKGFLAGSNDPKEVERIMAGLDVNKDGEADFQEFVLLVTTLTVACNEFFIDCSGGK